MALTISNLITHAKIGDFVMRVANLTAPNGGSETYSPGIGFIHFAEVTVKSAAAQPRIKLNEGVSGTSITGQIGLTNCSSGGVYTAVTFTKQG